MGDKLRSSGASFANLGTGTAPKSNFTFSQTPQTPSSAGSSKSVSFATGATFSTGGKLSSSSTFGTTSTSSFTSSPSMSFGTAPSSRSSASYGTGFSSQSGLLGSTFSSKEAMLHGFTTFPSLGPELGNRLGEIVSKGDADPQFTYIFYNLDRPSQKPPNVSNLAWQNALEKNPDPSRLAPVAVSGFQGLKERIEIQEKHALQQKEKLQEMAIILEEKQRKHETETTLKLLKLKQAHLRLSHSLLEVLGKIECSQARGIPFQASEDGFRTKLEQTQKELNAPGQYKSALNEVDAILMLQDKTPETSEEAVPFDEETLETMQNFLKQQHEGIRHLVNILEQDLEDTQKMLNAKKETQPGNFRTF